jgi:hypothetical protein
MNRYNNHKSQRRNAGGSRNKQSGSNKGQPGQGSDAELKSGVGSLQGLDDGRRASTPIALVEGQDDSDDVEADKSERLNASFEDDAKKG